MLANLLRHISVYIYISTIPHCRQTTFVRSSGPASSARLVQIPVDPEDRGGDARRGRRGVAPMCSVPLTSNLIGSCVCTPLRPPT